MPIFEIDFLHFEELNLRKLSAQRKVRGWIRRGLVSFVWLAPSCISFCRIHDVFGRLRSPEHPEGLPGIAGTQLQKVHDGNCIARFSANLLVLCLRRGVAAALENPHGNYFWKMPDMLALFNTESVHYSTHDYCQDGKPWRKRTGLCSMGVDLGNACKCCMGSLCSQTGKPHEQLMGTTGGVSRTFLAQAYPKPWCRRLVRLAGSALARRTGDYLAGFFGVGQ